MKKFLPWIIVLVVVLAIVGWFFSAYNSFVVLNQDVEGKWAQVENQYQRRMDLIPNLVATVQGVAKQEQAVFLGVAEARAKVGQVNVSADTLKEIPVVVLSTAGDNYTANKSRIAGADYYIQKPTSHQKLRNAISFTLTLDWSSFKPDPDNFIHKD